MKVTAIIPDQLVEEIMTYTGAKTITKALHVALREWIQIKRVKELNSEVQKAPLQFHDHFSASSVRYLNRKKMVIADTSVWIDFLKGEQR